MAMKIDPIFWCVWCEDGGPPTVKHSDIDKARGEAQRLARQNPGRRFSVLQAIAGFEKTDVIETRFTGVLGIDWNDMEPAF